MSACSRPRPSSASAEALPRVKGGLTLGLLLAFLPGARADDFELGLENYLYRSTTSTLNQGNIFGLAPTENLFRLTGTGRKQLGNFALKASAYVERQTGKVDQTTVSF